LAIRRHVVGGGRGRINDASPSRRQNHQGAARRHRSKAIEHFDRSKQADQIVLQLAEVR